MSDVLQVLYLVLYLFIVLLLVRLVAEYVLMFSRRWQPGRNIAAALEIVWSTTEPPLRLLRRLIPPIRLGSVSLDIGFMLLFLVAVVLENVVGKLIISA